MKLGSTVRTPYRALAVVRAAAAPAIREASPPGGRSIRPPRFPASDAGGRPHAGVLQDGPRNPKLDATVRPHLFVLGAPRVNVSSSSISRSTH